jgi:hypothetical protein
VGLFSSRLLWGLGGIEVDKKKVERYIQGLVPSSTLVVFLFFFPFFVFSYFYSFFPLFSVFMQTESI